MTMGWRILAIGVISAALALPALAPAEADQAARDTERLERIQRRVQERMPDPQHGQREDAPRTRWSSPPDENGRESGTRMPIFTLLAADLYGPVMIAARNVSNAARFEGQVLKAEEPSADDGRRAHYFWQRRYDVYRAEQAARLAYLRRLAEQKTEEIPFWRRQLEQIEPRGQRHARWISLHNEHLDRFEEFLTTLPDDDERLERLIVEGGDNLRQLLQTGESGSHRAHSREQRINRLRNEITALRGQLTRLENELAHLEEEEDWQPVLEMGDEADENGEATGNDATPRGR